jgi:hypothetical protein
MEVFWFSFSKENRLTEGRGQFGKFVSMQPS